MAGGCGFGFLRFVDLFIFCDRPLLGRFPRKPVGLLPAFLFRETTTAATATAVTHDMYVYV